MGDERTRTLYRRALGIGAGLALALGTPAASAAAAPLFLHEGGPVHARGVSGSIGATRLEVLRDLATVRCGGGTLHGKLATKTEQHTIAGLQLTLTSCTATNNVNGTSCPVHSAGAKGGGETGREITSAKLNGSLVNVSALESPTRVGLLMRPPRSGASVLTFEANKSDNCLPGLSHKSRKVQVVGGVIGAVLLLNHETQTIPIGFEVEVGPYGETSQTIQHPLSGPQQVLSTGGEVESPFRASLSLRFEEKVEVRG